jgi:membrane-associated phospholipid phosphatase
MLKGVWMRPRLFAVFFLIFLAPRAFAQENLFNSATAMKEEVYSLGDEALDVLRTPIDTKNYGLIGTIVVAGGVGVTYLFDDNIRNDLTANRSGALDMAADVGSTIGNPLVHIGIAGAIYGGSILIGNEKWQETGLMLGEAALLADGASLVLKESVGRARPFAGGDKGSFKPFQFNSDYDSMPSMHVASSFAMASVLSATSDSFAAKALYYTAASFVGFSRMYQDQHWASDVILGAAIGELCGRVVMRYHASGEHKLTLVPGISGNSASLALATEW